jgi:hypothetical protein
LDLHCVYPKVPKKVIIEIHSLSGFTEDAEYNAKIYGSAHTDWKN